MGIVQNQSIKNTIITFLGFGIGAVNALFFYTYFLEKEYYGIVNTVLSGANILMPIMAFGAQNTLIRFFSSYANQKERDEFLTFMLILPLAIIIPLGLVFYGFYDEISHTWIQKNPTLKPFFWLIPLIGMFSAYTEVFYAWAKVHMKSVAATFIYEILVRLIIMGLLVGVHFNWLSKETFVYSVALTYFGQLVAMKLYAISVKRPVLRFAIPENLKDIIYYSCFIIVSGGVAVMLIDFDKVMIAKYLAVSQNALYSVAIFIATVIAVPSRAMTQIVAPITARLMVEKKHDELNDLYKRSAINLQVIGGFIMILIFVNIKEMYHLIPKDYSGGIAIVFMIGLSKFYDVLLGNNNSIIVNTKYYRTVLLFGIATVVLMIVLNMIFIPLYGIEGSALATLITIVMYNTTKLFFVIKKMNLYPFTSKTITSLGILALCFVLFYFWDFPFHTIINIGLKSVLLSLLYLVLIYKAHLSEEINVVVEKWSKIIGILK
ncbi:lipopolysaccharide biosynthesis protein [Flavobacterium phycosphaerae]|uniref:lipopolysaccharide biosynthesis protein n=1 Tax=Flavobacterium phycosphaerae TaxID=2697515 RepID=UPI00138AC014|nr:polysaccharide biosynthesis C-terminal domain-containing protein [Flavobacterium phycosphaerae]